MNLLFDIVYTIRDFFGGYLVGNLWWLKIVSVILSTLFLWGIIYIIVKTDYFETKREQFLDVLGQGKVSRRRSLRAWKQIQKRINSKEQNQWKLAILEADHILNEILKMSGYLGSRMEDKLNLITPAQLANVNDVKNAHIVRDRIAKDPTFEITHEETLEIINIYKQSFRELNLIRE